MPYLYREIIEGLIPDVIKKKMEEEGESVKNLPEKIEFDDNNDFDQGFETILTQLIGNYHVGKTKKKDLQILKTLILMGADINNENSVAMTPIYLAVLTKNHEAAEFLLSHGAKIRESQYHGESLMDIANENSDERMKDILLKYGAKEW